MDCVKELISVIIPVYNRETYIDECLDSVLAQRYPHIEVVLVDDGSTDNTYALCEQRAAADNRIKLFKGEHGGVSAARNTALAHATGEYVFFLDSDDVIHPCLLETLITGMQEHAAAIGATDVIPVNAENWHKVRQKLTETDAKGTVVAHTAEQLPHAVLGGASPLSCIGGALLRRDLIGDTRFRTDLHIGEDFYFLYENLIKGAAAVFLTQKWYYARNHAHNSSWDYSFNGFWTRFYRRKLVWESELALGRTAYADRQKRSAFGCAVHCLEKNAPYSEDSKRIRRALKQHKGEFYAALAPKAKLLYHLYILVPLAAPLLRGRSNKSAIG